MRAPDLKGLDLETESRRAIAGVYFTGDAIWPSVRYAPRLLLSGTRIPREVCVMMASPALT